MDQPKREKSQKGRRRASNPEIWMHGFAFFTKYPETFALMQTLPSGNENGIQKQEVQNELQTQKVAAV